MKSKSLAVTLSESKTGVKFSGKRMPTSVQGWKPVLFVFLFMSCLNGLPSLKTVRSISQERICLVAYLSSRVDASEDVKLELVAVLQLEAEAGALLPQAAPVRVKP